MSFIRPIAIGKFLILAAALQANTASAAVSQTLRLGFYRTLEKQDARYDPNEQMIRRPFSSPGYHTTLKGGYVHPTRDSLNYAVALLDTGSDQRLDRATQILRKVISLQDQNPDSRTYGIWSWFYEEPLDKMSPPDWNWADFCGTQLLQVARDHMDRLPADLQKDIRESIIHACHSIKRRNVGPGYTNIALMGTYVTLSAGELFDDAEILEYGRSRLRRFWDYTQERGSFSEYNSPTYTVVAINEITRMFSHVKDPQSRPLIDKINRFAWFHLARHFHPPTQQWAGPHSRSYSTMLRSGTRAFIQRATEGRVKFMEDDEAWESLDAHRLDAHCPGDYSHYFTDLPEPRLEIETFQKRGAGKHDVIGTTYLHPDFALASANIADLWNQRRPLLAYWNTGDGVVSMRLRCLHDDYDYSSASIFTVQDKADLLGAVVFATDRGDTHISLDRIKDATITAKDLRLRLEFEGAVKNMGIAPLPDTANHRQITSGPIQCAFGVLYATFPDNEIEFDTSHKGDKSWIDIILYSGRQKKINFSEMNKAAIAFTISIRPKATKEELQLSRSRLDAKVSLTQDMLEATCNAMSLNVPVKPMKTGNQRNAASASLHGKNPWSDDQTK
jgi:hypothetical protein